jgi:hypothetical protein
MAAGVNLGVARPSVFWRAAADRIHEINLGLEVAKGPAQELARGAHERDAPLFFVTPRGFSDCNDLAWERPGA